MRIYRRNMPDAAIVVLLFGCGTPRRETADIVQGGRTFSHGMPWN
jgi:hypothetical protein